MFTIGNPVTGDTTGDVFETHEAADLAAIERSQDGKVWAVWDEEDQELVSLVFQERVFD